LVESWPPPSAAALKVEADPVESAPIWLAVEEPTLPIAAVYVDAAAGATVPGFALSAEDPCDRIPVDGEETPVEGSGDTVGAGVAIDYLILQMPEYP
jgi:hypothetical protein